MSEVRLVNLNKKYAEDYVVKDFNLTIPEGKFVVFLGPSGCGKTTTLRMVAGLEKVTSGKVFIGGQDMTHIKPGKRNVAMVFQNYSLYPHMTVYENMAFPLKVKKTPQDQIARKIKKTSRVLGIEKLLQRKPQELSGGQRQRVAIGRALVKNADVFLYDEPLSNLDTHLRNELRLEIKRRHIEHKSTTLYVTHDQVEAMTLADHVVLFHEGVIQQQGTPYDIYHRPANTFVAEFIGHPQMNLLKLHIYTKGNELWVASSNKKFALKLPARYQHLKEYDGKEVIWGIRTADVRVSSHLQDKQEGVSLNMEVQLMEYLGEKTILNLAMEKIELQGEMSEDKSFELGETVCVTFSYSKCHLFDAKTKKRL